MPNSADESIQLSEREIDILRLVATGASNKEIAQKLFISPNTVKVHLRNIFAKIEVISRTEATLYAIRTGLVTEGVLPPAPEPIPAPLPVEQPAAPPLLRRRWWLIGGIALLLALILAFGVLVQTGIAPSLSSTPTVPGYGDQRWKQLTALPQARKGLAAVNYENQIYIFSGETPQGILPLVERFDPKNAAWQSLAEKPTAVADIQAAVIGEKIYIPGGRLASDKLSNVLEVYDPRRDEWTQRASLPGPVAAYALASLEGRLFLFGGWDGQKALDAVYEYDPSVDSWQERSRMPQAAAYAGAVVKGARIYLIGGWDGNKTLSDTYIYYPEREQSGESAWEKTNPMPEGRYAFGAAEIADQIFVVGGDPDNPNPLGLVFNIEARRWDNFEAAPLPVGSHLGTVPYGDFLITLGGEAQGNVLSSQQICQVVYKVLMPIIRQDQ